MPKKESDKNSGTGYKCLISSPHGVRTLFGSVMSVIEKVAITFKYRKPSSPKYAIRTIPWVNVIAYCDSKGKGFISYYDTKVTFKKIVGTVDSDAKSGMMVVETEDNMKIFVRPDCLDAIMDKGVEAPEGEKSKPKKKKIVVKK